MKEKINCLRCGYSEFRGALHRHHLDYNPYNDKEDNVIILCSNCHLSLHHRKWKITELGFKAPNIQKYTWISEEMRIERQKMAFTFFFTSDFLLSLSYSVPHSIVHNCAYSINKFRSLCSHYKY